MSTPGPGHELWRDALGAYVLGALPEGEVGGFEEHLAGCPTCRQDVADLQVATDALPVSVPAALPPPALKSRIMAIVESEAALLAAAGERADRPEAPPTPARAPAAVPAPRRRNWWASLWMRPGFAAACAALLLLVGGVGGVVLSSGGGAEEVRTVTAQVDQTQAPGASVRLEVRDGGGTLVAEDMPPPPEGRVYQVWRKRPGRDPEPTDALWSVTSDGSARVAVPGSLDDVEAVLVTDEPLGGAMVPSKAPVITAQPA